ncbi:MAG TPA: class I SAM-dependent methyltransferase [Gaiellaceae bacterium]|nr:class I SAM-dependent methyltransferase [Gaiellaceae bacterium]
MSELPDYVAENRALWTTSNAQYTDEQADRAWRAEEITWGMFGNPETEVRVLGEVAGLEVVELGCGTAYFSAWLAARGARPVGVDVTPAQLDTARRLQAETGISFPLIESNAENVPLPDASFDLALSEYGASIWCDPYRWIPEAWRLLRPGGRLVFLCNSPLVMLCAVDEEEATAERLLRPQRGMHRMAWSDGGIDFHLGHGDMFRILRETGFEVENLIELYAPEGATTHEYYGFVTAEWARKWPAEEIWAARKRT